MAHRNENPLGIRKVDYQHERRLMQRSLSKTEAATSAQWMGLDDDEVIRYGAIMYARGWEEGVRVGVDKTKGRVAEALETGKLVKP